MIFTFTPPIVFSSIFAGYTDCARLIRACDSSVQPLGANSRSDLNISFASDETLGGMAITRVMCADPSLSMEVISSPVMVWDLARPANTAGTANPDARALLVSIQSLYNTQKE